MCLEPLLDGFLTSRLVVVVMECMATDIRQNRGLELPLTPLHTVLSLTPWSASLNTSFKLVNLACISSPTLLLTQRNKPALSSLADGTLLLV